jgi:Inner membrane protein YgaP-like, transmembrane domain
MKANVGIYDQGTRVLLAIAIAVLYYFNVIDGVAALIVAGVLVLTSLFGFCPLYKLFHINTEEKHSST